MSDSIIQVENLGKRYTIRHQQEGRSSYKSLREVMMNRLKFTKNSQSKFPKSEREDFWALKDVSFEIKQGDKVGVIGRNGAGKSTLLKILSRITEPTRGRIKIKGRVASLLEVGTGFHPELTGRENIFLNGAILGMSKVEIKHKFDEIVAFAEIEKFLDTPVKYYSSGMYVRLAFAVAAHLQTDILLVDEVLAVGDTEFQKKCLGKMQDVSRIGRTVILVSHQLGLIKEICTSGIVMSSGKACVYNSIDFAIKDYLKNQDWSTATEHLYSRYKYIKDVKVSSTDALSQNYVFFGESLLITTLLDNLPEMTLAINLSIKNHTGRLISLFSTNPHDGFELPYRRTIKINFLIDFCCFAPGEYFVDIAVTEPTVQILEEAQQIVKFEVIPQRLGGTWAYEPRFGDVFPMHKWEIIA